MDLKHELNDEQLKAVRALEDPILVLSSAGSGKTRIITYRIANMIEQGIDPANILTVTFTNKAAEEMTERTKELTNEQVDGIWMGTFHAIGCRILAENLDRIDYGKSFSIYDQNDSTNLLARVMENNDLSKDRIKPRKLQQTISSLKRNMKSPEQYLNDLRKEKASVDRYNQLIAECYRGYEEILRRDYIFDFEDLIKRTIQLLRNNDDVKEHYQNKFKHLQVDEYQDINNSQYIMTKILAKPQNNLLVVGDEDQCQPPGTNVLTTDGYKDIKDIDPSNDKLVSYSRKGSYVIGTNKGYNFEKAKRNYTGQLYTIRIENGKESKCTYNHKWMTKWLKKPNNKYAVYLMRQGNRFRVGECQLFNCNGALHLGDRMRLEKADSIWILKLVNDKSDAYAWENIISSRYGIPRITFRNTNDRNGYLTTDVINKVYENINTKKLQKSAEVCLKNFDKYIHYPFWSNEIKGNRQYGNTLFEVPACNIIPELMAIPVHKGGKEREWVKITEIKKEDYDGPVYSLNVDKYHKYISNEMVTCNSIYQFRGAELQNILNFQDEYEGAKTIKLERNYRSTENIVDASNYLIAHNNERIGKTARANKGSGDPIVVVKNSSPQAEGQFVADLAKRLKGLRYNYRDIAVLYRSHFQSEPVETKLIENDIPYQVVSSHRFFDREEIKNFIGILRFLNNPDDNLALMNIMKIFNNDIGDKLIGRMVDHARDNSIKLIDIIPNADVVNGIGPKRSEALSEFYDEYLIPSIDMINRDDIDLPEKISRIYHDIFNYNELLSRYDNPENRRENLQQLINYINLKHEKGNELIDILQNIALASDQDDPRHDDDNSVNLMTMHASKGTEYPVIIVIGMEEEMMPHAKSMNTLEEIEEERRLFYVAMTRAKEKLFLSHCYSRLKFGQRIKPMKSRFLNELPNQYYKRVSNF